MYTAQGWVFMVRRRRMRAALELAILLLAFLVTSPLAHAQAYNETVLHNFAGPPDGEYPYAGVVADKAGNLFGTTGAGGTYKFGTVFKIDKFGTETVLYSFKGTPDGDGPGILIQGNSGEFYGVTSAGGTFGFGTVFKLDKSGKEVVLYSFTGGEDGSGPGGLVEDAAGNLYGTTYGGGTSSMGTVFKLTPGGIETTLHTFSGMPDGEGPGGLIRDAAGNLYGTTAYAGPYPGCGLGYGCGIVFKISSAGTETVLYAFNNPNNGPDGYGPLGQLIQDAEGNLYGTTYAGGADGLYGTVYKLSPTRQETVLFSFFGDNDGENPRAGLVRDTAGNLYGTTYQGGNKGNCFGGFFYSGCGTVFEVSTNGQETQIHIFRGPDGEYPTGSLIRDASGRLYGTTGAGGSCRSPYGCGVVFELTPP
jgi:uncharacterized repeat protein (TIGR03803 family)